MRVSKLRDIIRVFEKYGYLDVDVGGEHDIIIFSVSDEDTPAREELLALGCHYESEFGFWATFT